MKKIETSLLVFLHLIFFAAKSQPSAEDSQAPRIKNIIASVQNKDIIVRYDLINSQYGEVFTLELWYSINQGSYQKCNSISCNDGTCFGVTSGIEKSITWNVLQDLSLLDAKTLDFEVRAFVNTSNTSSNATNTSASKTFVDYRDYKSYKYVTIGTQVWMAENLAYKPEKGNFWAYLDDQSNVLKYGYLYDWETARKVCPEGWHLPSDEEFNQLVEFLGREPGKKMKTTTGWKDKPFIQADNSSGFNGIPAGIRNEYDFYSLGEHAYFWTSTRSGRQFAIARFLSHYDNSLSSPGNYKTDGYSVRCVQN